MNNHKRGFTLIELLVVIAIIAILSVIGIVVYGNVTKNARDSQRLSNINNLTTALEAYYSQYGQYPDTAGCNGSGTSTEYACCSSWGPPPARNTNYAAGLVPNFIQSLSHDLLEPSYGGPDICYLIGTTDRSGYAIQFRLENRNDKAGIYVNGPVTENGYTVYNYLIKHNWNYCKDSSSKLCCPYPSNTLCCPNGYFRPDPDNPYCPPGW